MVPTCTCQHQGSDSQINPGDHTVYLALKRALLLPLWFKDGHISESFRSIAVSCVRSNSTAHHYNTAQQHIWHLCLMDEACSAPACSGPYTFGANVQQAVQSSTFISHKMVICATTCVQPPTPHTNSHSSCTHPNCKGHSSQGTLCGRLSEYAKADSCSSMYRKGGVEATLIRH